jgi:hypothetical protein
VQSASDHRGRCLDGIACGEGKHRAHRRRAGDQAQIARQPEQCRDHAAQILTDARHQPGVIRRLEQRITAGNHADRQQIRGQSETHRQQRQQTATADHPEQCARHHPPCAKAIHQPPGRYTTERRQQRPCRQHQANHRTGEAQPSAQVKRPDHQRGHHYSRHQQRQRQTAAQAQISEQRQTNQRRLGFHLDHDEQSPAAQADQQQCQRETFQGHRQRIGRQRHHQHPAAEIIKRDARRYRAICRQIAIHQPGIEQTQRHVEQKYRRPADMRHQHAAQRRPEGSAGCRHRRQQSHRTSRPFLGHRIGHQRHRQREHDCRAKALHRPCANQPAKARCQCAAQRGDGKNADADQQQSPPTEPVPQTSDADNQRSDRQQISEDDPLHLLKRRIKRRRQCRQSGVGDAGVQRWHQH